MSTEHLDDALERVLRAALRPAPESPLTEQDLLAALDAYFGARAATDAWLAAPNPVLGGRAPGAALAAGDLRTVHKLLLMALHGTPT